jgi:hypothetical protein
VQELEQSGPHEYVEHHPWHENSGDWVWKFADMQRPTGSNRTNVVQASI